MKNILGIAGILLFMSSVPSGAMMWGTPQTIDLSDCLSLPQAAPDAPGVMQLEEISCTEQTVSDILQKVIGKTYLTSCSAFYHFYGPKFAVTADDDHSLHSHVGSLLWSESTSYGDEDMKMSLDLQFDFDKQTAYLAGSGYCIAKHVNPVSQ